MDSLHMASRGKRIGFLFVAALLFLSVPLMAQAISVPPVFTEAEGSFGGQYYKSGLSGGGNMHWNNGAFGNVTVGISGSTMTMSRSDPTGPDAGLSASYTGTIATNGSVTGTVTWTWPGHGGYPSSGFWTAQLPPDKHLGTPCCPTSDPEAPQQPGGSAGVSGSAGTGASGGAVSAAGIAKSSGAILHSSGHSYTSRRGGGASPVDAGTGNLFHTETDYVTEGPNTLDFTRYYNGLVNNTTFANEMGVQWRHNYDRYLNALSSSFVTIERADGQQLNFNLVGGVWKPDTDIDMTLTNSGLIWTLTDHDDTVETYQQVVIGTLVLSEAQLRTVKTRNGYTQTLAYNGSNQLVTVTDSYGRQLGFTYTGPLLTQVTTPDALTLTYGYNSSGVNPGLLDRLASVSYNTSPASQVTYQYENVALPFALTGITDENASRYITWSYDAIGRVLTSQLAGGANLNSFSYNDAAGTRTITNALGQQTTYGFTLLQGVPKITSITRTATATVPASTQLFSYDGNGFRNAARDWNNNGTTYANNTHGDPTTIIEAFGTAAQRSITITYDTTFVHLPKTIVTAGLTVGFTYDASGNVLTRKLTDTTTTSVPYSTNGQTRTWTYSWSNFLPASLKTPNTNTTLFTFDASGALTGVTNPLSQSVTVTSHTGGGLPLSVTDANGVVTTLAYDARNRLTSKTVSTTAGNLITSFSYDAAGNLLSVTAPDGAKITNSFDAAHRLTQASDLFGNSINYTLDALADATGVAIKDPGGAATRSVSAAFDTLGRRLSDTNGTGWKNTYAYDSNSNVTSFTPPTGSTAHTYTFDALNRDMTEAISGYGNITLTYNTHDRPLTVTDRNAGVTSYVYDGFGDAIQVSSPDSGTTVYHYDADGNATSKTDAAAIVANYSYDALDRVTAVSYPASAAENVAYSYDQTGTGFTFGIGRLTSWTDAAGSHTRSYDERGNLTADTLVSGALTLATSYGYDAASRLASVTYPSGTVANYTRDAMGRVTSVSATPAGGSPQTLASLITYKPFGPWVSVTYGNGIAETAGYDADYALTSLVDSGSSTAQNVAYAYALQDQPSSATDILTPGNNLTLAYDTKQRLTTATATGVNATSAYDANDNRTGYGTSPNAITASYTLHTNRLASYVAGGSTTTVTTDARGEVTAFSNPLVNITGGAVTAGSLKSLGYNNAGQLGSASGTAGVLGTYVYDAFGNRFSKATASGTTVFSYAPDGTLLEEVSPAGVAKDYFYLNGRPLAMLDNTVTPTFTWLHDDRLGTPQAATDASQNVVWSGSYLPFGTTLATAGTVTVNLRRPGQYFDSESGLFNNGFRTYIPQLARYAQTDPIGLGGGWNDYVYVEGRPLTFTDRWGLAPWDDPTLNNPAFNSPSFQNGKSFGLLGKAWTLPNTAIGILSGSAAYIGGLIEGTNPSICIGNNAIQFTGSPWGGGAVTLGNTQIFTTLTGPDTVVPTYDRTGTVITRFHEEGHTYQYENLGPFFLPAWALFGGPSASNPLESGADAFGQSAGTGIGSSCGCRSR
jgi:RHS repeat-associated protein